MSTLQRSAVSAGTIDYSGYLAIPEALAFVKTIGGFEAVRKYNHGLVIWAAEARAVISDGPLPSFDCPRRSGYPSRSLTSG